MSATQILAELLQKHEPLIAMVEPYQAAALVLQCPKADNGYDLWPHWLTLDYQGVVHGYRGVVANNYDDSKKFANIARASTALTQLLNQDASDAILQRNGYARIQHAELIQRLIPTLPPLRLMPIRRLLGYSVKDRAQVLFYLYHGRVA